MNMPMSWEKKTYSYKRHRDINKLMGLYEDQTLFFIWEYHTCMVNSFSYNILNSFGISK